MTMFRKAERKQAKLRLAICAPSGAGKTYGALMLAKGLGDKVALLDTENGSGDLYADLYSYDVCPISAPYSPEKYIDVIKGAEKAGYEVLIIDSLTHAWAGEGGILDMHTDASKNSQNKGNSYTAWRDVTPQHNALVNAMLQSKMHIIVTMRSKVSHEIQDDNGKKKVIKLGLAPIQREGMDYEFTVVMDVAIDSHIACTSKDRTRLFDGKNFKITEETGTKLLGWLNDGASQEDVLKRDYDEFSSLIKVASSLDELKIFYVSGYKKLEGSQRLQELLTLDKDQKKEEFLLLEEDFKKKIAKEVNIIDREMIEALPAVIQDFEIDGTAKTMNRDEIIKKFKEAKREEAA